MNNVLVKMYATFQVPCDITEPKAAIAYLAEQRKQGKDCEWKDDEYFGTESVWAIEDADGGDVYYEE